MPREQSNAGTSATTKPPGPWDRMEKWQQIAAVTIAAVCSVFAAGVTFQRAKASLVFADAQAAVDGRQDELIRAVQDDAGNMHVHMDDLHDEVRGMRLDLRFFDPRIRGGGLAELPAETPRPTPPPAPTSTVDPSMSLPLTGLPVPAPSPIPSGR